MVCSALVCLVVTSSAPLARGADRPSTEDAYAVYQQVDRWLRQNALPARNTPREARAIDPDHCDGAAIVLRLSGQVIGRAEVIDETGTAVWQAASAAWESAYPVLIEDLPNDALYEDRLRERLQRFTLDLQLAGPLVPLPAETFSGAGVLINPGLQGAAARSGAMFKGVFPGTIMSFSSTADAGFDPGERALRLATTRLGMPPVDLGILRQSEEVTLYRFDVTHLAQTRAGLPPEFLVRGGRLVSEAAVTTSNLRSMADVAAEYLLRLEWPGDEPLGMLGDYRATANRYSPYIAPPREQATAAFALARYANTRSIAPARSRHASTFARTILEELTRVAGDEIDPRTDPLALSTWLLAWAELSAASPERAIDLPDVLDVYAREAVDTLLSREAAEEIKRAGAESLAALAMAKASRHFDAERGKRARDSARTSVRAQFRELPAPRLVAAMPWLGWAEIELASDSESVPASIALRDMRDLIWEFQIDPITAGSDNADFVGGIVFSRGSTQLPTWQSLRPIAIAATMLGDERLTDDEELFAQLTPLLRAMRFVMQLSVDRAEGHNYPVPERAMGGLRLSIWEQTVSIDATSLGLIAICELLDAMESRSGR